MLSPHITKNSQYSFFWAFDLTVVFKSPCPTLSSHYLNFQLINAGYESLGSWALFSEPTPLAYNMSWYRKSFEKQKKNWNKYTYPL